MCSATKFTCSAAKFTYLLLAHLVIVFPVVAQPPSQNSPSKTPSDEELFERAFGRRPLSNTLSRLSVPLIINNQEAEQLISVQIKTGQPSQTRIQSRLLIKTLSEIVRPDIISKIQAAVGNAEDLSIEVLQQNGLDAKFDEQRVALVINIPPNLIATKVSNIDVLNLPPEAKEAVPPSSLSGFINLRASEPFVWSNRRRETNGRLPLSLNVDGAINFNSWVFEGSGTFTESENPNWIRGDLRFVKDDPLNAVRYSLGDFPLPVTGFQNSVQLLGVAATRNFSLQPYTTVRPVSRFEFLLERPSRVEVYSNGRLIQTLQLPAGQQDLRQLPFTTGINDIHLVVTDDLGRQQSLDFKTAVAAELLAPGIQQFAYSLGVPAKTNNSDRNYDWSLPTLSLNHRWGVSEILTLGGYLQANSQQQLLGLEGIWATNLGNIGWDVAFSNDHSLGSDYAWRLRYEYYQSGEVNNLNRRFGLDLEQRGARFIRFGNSKTSNDNNLSLAAFYRQKIFDDIDAGINAQYRFGRDNPDTYQVGLDFSKYFNNGLQLNFRVDHNRTKMGTDEERAMLSLQWTFDRGRQSVQSTAEVRNTEGPTQQVTWNYKSPQASDAFSYSLGVATNPNGYGLNGRLTYTGYRGVVELFPNIFAGKDGTRLSTGLAINTAIAFADGHWALSRPIEDSFVMVVPEKNLEGQTIGVNPDGVGTYIGRADGQGPGVVPNLPSYIVSRVLLDAPDLPLGIDLGKPVYYVMPSYKSGTVLRVGTDATVFIRGTLVDRNGSAIALQAGEIRSTSDPQWQPLSFFTNKAGKFALTGLKPGSYELRLSPSQAISFTIPEKTVGVYELGTLKLDSSK